MASAFSLVERPAYGGSGAAQELGIPALPGSAPFGHGGALPSINSVERDQAGHSSPVTRNPAQSLTSI